MDWVKLETFWSLEEAQLAVAYLQARQISCHLEGTAVAGNFWHLSNATGGVKLMVAPDMAESAAEMLAEVQAQRTAEHSPEITDEQPDLNFPPEEEEELEQAFDSDIVPAGHDNRFGDDDDNDDEDERPTLLSHLRENRLWIVLFVMAPIYFGIIFVVLGLISIIVWPFSWISSRIWKDDEAGSKPVIPQ